MSIRIPVRSDIDIRNAFDDVVQEISDLKKELARVRGLAAPQLPTTPTPTTNLDLAYIDPADMNSGNAGPGTVLTSDGAGNPSWAPPLGGLVTVGEAGEGGRSMSQPVLGVNGSLAVLNALSADSVRCRQLRPKVTGVKVRRVSDTTFAQSGAAYAIPWTTTDFDTDDFHEPVTNPSRITIPAGLGGVYLVGFNIEVTVSGNATFATGLISSNGAGLANMIARDIRAAGTSPALIVNGSYVTILAGGEYIEALVYCDGAGTATVNWTDTYDYSPQFYAIRLGGA